MRPYLKLMHVNPNGDEKNLASYVLSIQVSQGAEAIKNTVTIELQNHDGELNAQAFTIDQSSLTLYLDWEPITSQDPLISSIISGVAYPTGNSGKYKIKIKGTDKTGLFLSKVWAIAYIESDSWKVSSVGATPENSNTTKSIIHNLVGHLNDLDSGATGILTTTNVATLRSDGTAFPSGVSISKIWKPGYEWLNEMSQTEYTGETLPYVYFVDKNNDLHWHYPEQKSPSTLSSDVTGSQTTIPVESTSSFPSSGNIVISSEVISYTGTTTTTFTGCTRGAFLTSNAAHTSGTVVSGEVLYLGKQDIYNMDISTTQDSTYNFIIFNGGKTPEGFELLDYTLDFSQRGRTFRMKFFDWKEIGKTLANDEKARSEWGTDKSTSYPQPGDAPLGGGNPYTPTWSAIAVTSDAGYQASFVVELTRRCRNKASTYFLTGKQKYKATVQMRGNTQFIVNEIVTVTSPKFSADGATTLSKLLRIKDIKNQLTKGAWITDIELTEDPDPTST